MCICRLSFIFVLPHLQKKVKKLEIIKDFYLYLKISGNFITNVAYSLNLIENVTLLQKWSLETQNANMYNLAIKIEWRKDMFNHKKSKRISSIVIAAALLTTQPAMAFDVSYDGGDSDINVKGCTDLKKAGQIVTLKAEDSDNNLLFVRQTETNVKGEWEFVFTLDYEGDVTVNVSESGKLEEEQTIYRSTSSEVTDALDAMNTDSISNAVQTYASVLQIDYSEYASLVSSGLLDSFMISKRSYNSIGEVKNAYNLGKFLVTVEKSSSGNDILTFEKKYPEVSEATKTSASDIYEGYEDSEKTSILSKLCKKTYSDMSVYAKARDEAVIINEINKADNYNEKFGIIELYNSEVLGLDLTKYSSLGEKYQTFKQNLLSKPVTDLATLKSDADAIYSQLSQVTGGGVSGGGGGGGAVGGVTNLVAGTNYPVENEVTPIPQFDDMTDYDWAKTAVYTLAAQKVINGKADGIFAPADNVTRAEFAKMLAGAFKLSGNAEIKFYDIPENHWAYEFVAASVANSIVSGYSDNLFGADDKITRQDMATICGRLMEVLNAEVNGEEIIFADENEISDYAKDAVKKLAMAGIINGVGENRFAPTANATRAEAAVMIYNLREYCKGGN